MRNSTHFTHADFRRKSLRKMRSNMHFTQNAHAEIYREIRREMRKVRILRNRETRKVPGASRRSQPPKCDRASVAGTSDRSGSSAGDADWWARTPTLQVLRGARALRDTCGVGQIADRQGEVLRLRGCAILPSTSRYVPSRFFVPSPRSPGGHAGAASKPHS